MGQALYRKYRSKKLSEIVGQEHITTTLENALKSGSISHAYLFTGPRGVGKTSIARILAHAVNGLTYDEKATHLDIIEIDAASNRRIDEIRELREKVHNAPSSAKFKVYIIDEVHMLTREAFNALLKTLEEPPAHAIFILATTEAHKVPETILSRTQRFAFKPIQNDLAVAHLRSIADKEGITISDEALELIASHSEGSFRDSISLLDQVRALSDKVTLEDVQAVLGIASKQSIEKLLALIQNGEAETLLQHLAALRQRGYQAPQLARQLSQKLREQLLNNELGWSSLEITKLLQALLAVGNSHDPATLLELTLLETMLENQPTSLSPEPRPAPAESADADKEEHQPSQPKSSPMEPIDPAPQKETEATLDDTIWQQVLQAIKRKHNTLYGIARMATAKFNNDELILSFAFGFHQKRLNEDKNRQLISDLIKKQTGKSVTITCIVDKEAADQTALPKSEIKESVVNSLDNISNIFGPSEVLE